MGRRVARPPRTRHTPPRVPLDALDDLVKLVAQLRAPDGCPWDREQTPESMRTYLLEENDDTDELMKELGDLLFLVALVARMYEERGVFKLEDVVRTVTAKMVRRHPHVFGDDADVDLDAAQVVDRWEAIKAQERGQGGSALDGVPSALPSLLRAHRVSEKAAAVGFDWTDASGPRRKLDEEISELDQALADGDRHEIDHELGDVLFTLVNLGRHVGGTGADDALRIATDRFSERFRGVEARARAAGVSPHDADPDTLERWWQQAKEEGR